MEITQEEVMFMLIASYISEQAYLKGNKEVCALIDQCYQQVFTKNIGVLSKQYWQLAKEINITINGKDIRPKRLIQETCVS